MTTNRFKVPFVWFWFITDVLPHAKNKLRVSMHCRAEYIVYYNLINCLFVRRCDQGHGKTNVEIPSV